MATPSTKTKSFGKVLGDVEDNERDRAVEDNERGAINYIASVASNSHNIPPSNNSSLSSISSLL